MNDHELIHEAMRLADRHNYIDVRDISAKIAANIMHGYSNHAYIMRQVTNLRTLADDLLKFKKKVK
jgi:hypothetical protein